MNRNTGHTVYHFLVGKHLVCYYTRRGQIIHKALAVVINRYTHSEDTVRIASKNFSVEEIAPSSHYLAYKDPHGNGIKYQWEAGLLMSCKEYNSDNTCDKTSVYSKSAITDIDHILYHSPRTFSRRNEFLHIE